METYTELFLRCRCRRSLLLLTLLNSRYDHLLRVCCPPGQRPSLLQQLSLSVQIAQVRLPPDGHDARENTPKLKRQKGHGEGDSRRPHLERVEPAGGDGIPNPLDRRLQRLPGQEGLRAEKVRAKGGREAELVEGDLGSYGQRFGRVVEVVT